MAGGKRKLVAASRTKVGKRKCSSEDKMKMRSHHNKAPTDSDDDAIDKRTTSLPSTSRTSNPSASNSLKNQSIVTISLPSLPFIILTQVIESLFTSDIRSLACVNQFLSDFISSHYTTSVILPGSPPRLPNRFVLSLSISCNVSQLPDIQSYHHLKMLNIKKLKQLQLTGNNHIWNKQYLLSDKYKSWLEYLLNSLNKVSIQKLEFLTDESKRCIDAVRNVDDFHNLTEVTLHGIGYFNPTASYHMDKDVAQKIISNVLINKRLKILRLKYFQTLNRCLVIESECLEELYVEFGKHFEIGLLYLPNVRVISMETSMWFGCFYHAQNGELKKIVAQGCPKLENFNTIDLESLSRKSESNHWLDQLKTFSASQQQVEGQCVLCMNPDDE
eukprot:GFUD01005644.1.p1 GENE.GFUD01005644.1~~GFUD01005644.1.p1  ORF type:complete len:387 (+),score=57.90 GFUD01005644.1:86-1246(+)